MASGKNPYGVSFIQTSTGAMITGEIKRYDTYKQMVEDPAPTRLASVNNASQDHQQYLEHVIDEDYAVPDEHIGGILYQHDFVSGTWILLYTAADLAVPTYVEWDRILNVPTWVGGVSNHRVKLAENTYAVPRTTYYCFGNKEDQSKPYRLVLPPTGTEGLKLGDEIVLEQYENVSIVLYEKPDGVEAYEFEETIPDADGKTYFYIYASPYYTFEVNDQGKPVPGTEKPLTANIYRFIYTETDDGIRVWRPCIVKDNIDPVITHLKRDLVNHESARDPHPIYLKRSEVAQYIPTVPTATQSAYGIVRLASVGDVEAGSIGPVAVTADVLKMYTHIHYSVLGHTHPISDVIGLQAALDQKSNADHTHEFYELENIPFKTTLTVENQDSENTIVTPKMLYDQIHGHTHSIPEIKEVTASGDEENPVIIPTGRNLQEVLDNKSDVGHTHFLSSIIDYVAGMYLLSGETDSLPFDDPRNCPGGYFKFPIKQHKVGIDQNKIDVIDSEEYLIVQWGVAAPGSDTEGPYNVTNIPYPLDVVLHVGFTTINDAYAGSNGDGRDATVQLRSITRDANTSLATGFEYFLQRTDDDATDVKYRFIWIMIGIDRPASLATDKYTLVLESGITPVGTYDTAYNIGFVRPFGTERATTTKFIGMTAASSANKVYMSGQLARVFETTASSLGSFDYFMQDAGGDYANKSNRQGRMDWMRLGFNQYAADKCPTTVSQTGSWSIPASIDDPGLVNALEIPLPSNVKYYPSRNYIVIPLTTNVALPDNASTIALFIEWGETEKTSSQKEFEQRLMSLAYSEEGITYSNDFYVQFVDFITKNIPTTSGGADSYEDSLNWQAQFVSQTSNGFSYFPQLFSSTANEVSFDWIAFYLRIMSSSQSIPTVGSINRYGHIVSDSQTIVEIPITINSSIETLVIAFGTTSDYTAQNGTNDVYALTVNRALKKVYHVAFGIDNANASSRKDLEAELWTGTTRDTRKNGSMSNYAEPSYDVRVGTTSLRFSLYQYDTTGDSDKAQLHWLAIGLKA